MALAFRDNDALHVVIASGMCPPDVQARGARIARTDDGGVIVEPDEPLTKAVLAHMKRAGVVVDATLPPEAHAVRCWAEAIRPAKVEIPEIPSLVLIVSQDAAGLVDLAAELVRLGCERQELLVTDTVGVARVVDPPTYTIVRALDRDAGLQVFAPDPPGQERVWTELGYKHALAARLKPEPKSLLLVARDGWDAIPDEGWRGLDTALELAVPARAEALVPSKLRERRRVELRLSTGRREAGSLWVIRQGGVAAIDKLLEYLPEEIVARLMFAVSATEVDGPDPIIILRARTGRHPPPDLSLDAEMYAPLSQMPDVYAPAGAIVEPPLRRERLRQVLGVGPNEVMWLAQVVSHDPNGTKGRFRVERITETAFTPLGEWAEYVIHASAPAIQGWMRASVFEFAPFVSTGLEWASGPAEVEDDDAQRKKKDKKEPTRRGRGTGQPAEAPASAPRTVTTATAPTPRAAAEVEVAEVQIDEELAALEAEFVALDAPGDAPERIDLLLRLARSYARLGRRRDAGLCYARAVWEGSAEELPQRLDAWIASELRTADARVMGMALDRILGAAGTPNVDDVRLVAAIAARAPAPVARDPHRLVRWLDDHDGDLDARTLWLARVGLGNLTGGDTLGLAHARDRILGRLASGLPVERELPAFLRFGGRSGALGNASGEHLTKALEDLVGKIAKTKRKRSPVEASVAHTGAYVNFMLGHGFARIGKHERARELVGEATKALAQVASDTVHKYLIGAFSARVEQAISGLPSEAPLPDAIGAELAGLDRVARYKVDRLREASRILEPLERPDAIGAFSKRQADSRGPEFAALRAISDPVARARELDKLVQPATDDEAERERLVDGILDVLLELPEAQAVPILARTWPLIARVPEARRAILYGEALVVAGHFGRMELVPEMLELLGLAIPTVAGADLERVLDSSLRALRRIGLRNEIAELLTGAEAAIPPARADALRARLALAGGLAYLGEFARAQSIFEQARETLAGSLTMPVRLEITRSLAGAYSQAPLANALGGIGELAGALRDVTDSFGTNSHYCLSVLHFVESLVLGITSDDLALGEAGRRFVEDDEHLIRRRLHRDLGGHS
ncbi:MAG: hypothetical protein NT062_04135 [Proteobacteria bacterium]|nr:hypothetical protein [Pseudomonadota bacterium]